MLSAVQVSQNYWDLSCGTELLKIPAIASAVEWGFEKNILFKKLVAITISLDLVL